MSSSLTDQQIKDLKSRLLATRDQLSQQADEQLQASREQPFRKLAGDVHDKGDESIAAQVSGLDAELAERHAVEIHAIDAALQRIEDGTYGICIDCGDAISFPRLRAYPMAQRCIECKRKLESEHSGPGSPTL